MATTLAEHLAIQKVDGDYISTHLPQKLGNSAAIAYGGYAIGLAIRAAYEVAPEGFHLYSAMGHYLRAAHTESSLICTPIELRLGQSFATYRVVVQQKDRKTGNLRSCMELLVDFHRDEPSLLTHSAPPTKTYTHWKDCLPADQAIEKRWIQSGKLSESQLKPFKTLFGLSETLYDTRPCPEGVTAQNLLGMAKDAQTTQEYLSPTSKSSADWVKVKHPLNSEAAQMAALGFFMDGMLSFLPLSHNHLFFQDAGACSSLDFALRVFVPRPNINDWHMREAINHRAGQGRTYSESRLWDDNGNLVASMTQQSILRVPTAAAKI